MSRGHRTVASFFLAAALFAPVVFSGCSARASYRVYDPGHEDYHVWDSNEDQAYRAYLGDQHIKYRSYSTLGRRRQTTYWNYRHTQGK